MTKPFWSLSSHLYCGIKLRYSVITWGGICSLFGGKGPFFRSLVFEERRLFATLVIDLKSWMTFWTSLWQVERMVEIRTTFSRPVMREDLHSSSSSCNWRIFVRSLWTRVFASTRLNLGWKIGWSSFCNLSHHVSVGDHVQEQVYWHILKHGNDAVYNIVSSSCLINDAKEVIFEFLSLNCV